MIKTLLRFVLVVIFLAGASASAAVVEQRQPTFNTPADNVLAPHTYRFYKYQMDVGYYNRDWTNLYIHKQFTWPNIPIFWKGRTRAQNGYMFSFQNNFFHTSKYFSLDWGVSAGEWNSHVLSQNVSYGAIYLALKLWLIRSDNFQFYFTYSAAGPCYMSQSMIDNNNMYSKFTFQDFMGIGAFIGKNRALEVSLKLLHYSNGFLVPSDPGFDVPVVFSLGYAFNS